MMNILHPIYVCVDSTAKNVTHHYISKQQSLKTQSLIKLAPLICLVTFFLTVVNTLGSIWADLKARGTDTLEGSLLVDAVTILTDVFYCSAFIHICNNDTNNKSCSAISC